MNELISIILPCYKAERYLGDMIDDVVAQTYRHWELIVVSNGAGQDAQLAVAQKRADKDSRIKVLTVVKGGVSNARNVGLREAQGDWITFVDADDRITHDHLQRYVDAVEQAVTRPDIVVGGLLQIRSKENLEIKHEIKGGMGLCEYVRTCGEVINNGPYNKLYHKSIVAGHTFNINYTVFEDQMFNLQVLLDVKYLLTIPMTGYRYICSDEASAMSRFHATLEETKIEAQKIYNTLCLQIGMTEEEVRQVELKKKFLQAYFFVCNLFKPGCPYSLYRKRNEIERMIFKDKEMAESARMCHWKQQVVFIKIWIACYKTHSAWLTTLAFALQYWAKRRMRPLYFKIAPLLRRK